MKVAIIGGGAAGFFAAIQAKENFPEADVVLFEKTNKLLAKVKVSGGGRCNVTNGCQNNSELATGYPRGRNQLKKAFKVFNNNDTQKWFEERGVSLKTEPDNRVFPVSNDSQTIIDCLMAEANRLAVNIQTGSSVESIKSKNHGIQLKVNGVDDTFEKVIVATGGSPKRKGLEWLEDLGHKIEDPVPSLFTFNMPQEPIKKLMGVVAPHAQISVQGTKLKSEGPLLITHWGMSGPAVLKLSSFGARELADRSYQFKIQVSWLNELSFEKVLAQLSDLTNSNPKKQIQNVRPNQIPDRLWLFLLSKAEIELSKPCAELGKKALNKLVNFLVNDVYEVSGKTTFKEEFVTCGGVSLESIDFKTMQSRVVPNLYFAGEILDIDGITGGYNFQAAWTTGFIAGKLN